MSVFELKKIASRIRVNVLETIHRSKGSHVGSCFSIVDILVVLYSGVMNVGPKNINNNERDIFILSKGHAAVALYATLAEFKFCKISALDDYAKNGTKLAGHVIKNSLPGIEVSSGSLGHGLSMAVGFALAAKLNKTKRKVFCLLGDGECNEGSVWEAVMLAAQKKLNNLCVIIDYNNQQGMGISHDIISQTNLRERFQSFGCDSYDVNGHDFKDLLDVFKKIKNTVRPVVIVAKTIKGKGVGFMENNVDWHYKCTTDDQYPLALKEIKLEI